MAKNLDHCRLCRRAGVKLYLKGDRCFTPKCAIVKRNYPPGVQGAKRGGRQRITPYGVQLREKQKARFYYGVSESQFRKYFDAASSKVGNTSDLFMTLLELRLDSMVYRLGWAWSRKDARQLVSHGHILVNGKKVTIPSYQVRVGDVISVKSLKAANKHFAQILPGLEKHTLPEWLTRESGAQLQGKVVSLPKRPEDTVAVFDMKPIIEFYSRQ